jgi:MoaA/NifB/PqqE/SkfB family radical SAM enzyme
MIRTVRAILGPARPVILYHKPTARCDCRCKFCDSWIGQPEEDDSLPSEKILGLIERAHAAGMTMYTVWGGEPLVVENLPEWLKRAKELGMMTTVCTSGFRLPERAVEVAPHIDQLLLSLEAVGESQDRIRARPGLFDKITSGLGEFKKHGRGEVVLWSNLSRENMDQVEAVAGFAKEQGVLVEFFPAALYPGYNEKMVLDEAERDEVFSRAAALKRAGYPVYNSYYALELMRSGRPFTCNVPRLAVQVFPDGSVYACEPRVIAGLEPYGNIDGLDLSKFPVSQAYQQARQVLSSCNACLLPCVANMADSLVIQAIRRSLSGFYYRSLLSTNK